MSMTKKTEIRKQWPGGLFLSSLFLLLFMGLSTPAFSVQPTGAGDGFNETRDGAPVSPEGALAEEVDTPTASESEANTASGNWFKHIFSTPAASETPDIYVPKPLDKPGGTSRPDFTKGLDEKTAVSVKTRLPKDSETKIETKLEPNTAIAWSHLQEAAKKAGFDFFAISYGTRTVKEQQRLYDAYLARNKKAPEVKKPIGAHNTGRAIDIFLGDEGISKKSPLDQQENKVWKWLNANAATFGFYGYSADNPKFEAWHWVYNPKAE